MLSAGNYGGLVTHSDDVDTYQLNTVYSDTLQVTVEGEAGLDVASYDASGNRLATAVYLDGSYTIDVANEGYLYVKGTGLKENNAVDSYSLFVSDVADTYIAPEGAGASVIDGPVVLADPASAAVLSVFVEDGLDAYYSTDMTNWTLCVGGKVVVNSPGDYYFKAVDSTDSTQKSDRTLFTVSDAIYNIDISGAATSSTLIANLAEAVAVGNWANTSFTVTVGTPQTNGDYILAGGAAGFNKTITLRNASGNLIGTLSVGGQLYTADALYTLTLTDDEQLLLNKTDSSAYFTTRAKPFGGDEATGNPRDIVTDVEGVYFKYNVMGGLNYTSVTIPATADQVETGNISLRIGTGSRFDSNVCGDRVNSGSSLRRIGDVNITINGGEFKGFVVGGQYLNANNPKTVPSALLTRAVLVGNVDLTITGGTFTGEAIYGGSYSSYKICSGNTMITGNVTTTFRAEGNRTISVAGHYYAGSYNHGIIGGNVTTVISGSGTIAIGGEIWGGCGGDYYTVGATRTFETTILGDRILSITGCTGNLTAQKIRGYNSIEFVWDADNRTSFAFADSGYNLSDIANWTFAYGCDVSGNFANSFVGDTLNLTLDNWTWNSTEDDWTILTNTNANGFLGFSGENTFASVTLGGQTASLSDGCWVSKSYKMYLSGSSMKLTQIA